MIILHLPLYGGSGREVKMETVWFEEKFINCRFCDRKTKHLFGYRKDVLVTVVKKCRKCELVTVRSVKR